MFLIFIYIPVQRLLSH